MTGLSPEIESVDAELAKSESEFIALANKRAALLRRKLAAFDALFRERQQIQAELHKLDELLKTHNGVERQPQVAPFGVTNVVPGEFESMPVWEAAREILRREHRQMFTGEIVTRLLAGGRALRTENKSSQVNASISQKEDIFCSVKRKGKAKWGLMEWKEERKDTKSEGLTSGLEV